MSDLDACVRFLQHLIQTPSLPGQEGDIADLVHDEMERLGYEVSRDEAGNVIGKIAGRGVAPPIAFNTHLDHVDVGDPDGWFYPPFGGEIHDEKVWGRGAVDIKGPLAAQVYGVGRLLAESPPDGDLLVTAVVQEEIGGVGARHLAPRLESPWIVVGEPSRNTIRRGHRGRTELLLHIVGRSAHASVPDKAVHPLEVLANFVHGLAELEMREDPDLGASTVALTLLHSDQSSANVTPGEIWVTCDWRNVPGETGQDACRVLQEVAEASLVPGATVEVTLPVIERESYTGLRMKIPGDNPAYILAEDHPAVAAAREVLDEIAGSEPPGFWQFATDGGHFAAAGLAPVGFGPGDEFLAHTNHEHVPIAALETAVRGNELLARGLPRAAAEGLR